ncbi:glycosyltransferase [Agromyces sp. CFH 90414]|uniref:Glycosyltransferase n=1 Tax=Agromyces agglutinans TaxID=2662258 RepID=A0A6I2F725_9MICO|nr:glycosyltransferase family 2 protein [Agromyces agglutinans]MRG60429.1 glycosyltransferase [Agromyces agglutinans]
MTGDRLPERVVPEAVAAPVMTTLDVVVVTYGRSDLVRECLSSLQAARPATPMTVMVVDNASPDDTPDVVGREFPWVELRRRPTNDGFAVANNAVLRDSTAKFVLLLNPDTRMEPGTLDHLIAVMEDNPDIGMIGCRLLTADGGMDHAAKRSIPTIRSAIAYFALRAVGRSGSAYLAPEVGDEDFADVDAINGAFMLVRGAALGEVGLLDETYWMYAEDLDWCVRFRAAGWRVVYDGSVIAHHLKGGSSDGPRRLRLNYHFHRSMAVFYRQHSRSGNPMIDGVAIAGIWSRFALTSLLNGMTRAVRKYERERA